MKTSRLLSVLALQLLTAAAAQAATRIDLNHDWAFRVESGADGVNAGWPARMPSGTAQVAAPHSWNRAGADYDYLGVGWYFRRFELPKLPVDATVQLHFGATFYKARVWLNGVDVGAHEGGYTSYSFDITPHLRDDNLLAVAIDNRPGMITIPGFGARGAPDAWYDWWAYGGLVGDVWIDVHGPVRIANQFIRSKPGANATVSNRVTLVSRGARSGTLRATVTSPSRDATFMRQKVVTLKDGSNEVTIDSSLSDIQRWDLDHPNLYHMTVDFLDGDATRRESAGNARLIESAATVNCSSTVSECGSPA
jgi:beta-galactosidase/beta-glucuronidase